MDLDKVLMYTNNLNVLYAEDSTTLRKITQKKLEPLFKHLDTATDGDNALDQYKAYHESTNTFYDIVITDLEMPNMDGSELSRQVLDFNPSQEIIVISANIDFNKIVDLINIGIHKFLSKPVEDDPFYQVIFDIAQKIRLKRLEEEDQKEIAEYNKVLKERENDHLADLNKHIKELESFKHALDASAIISKTDIDGNIIYVNDKFCHISGYSEEELLGRNHNILSSGRMSKSFFQKLWNTIHAKKNHKSIFENRAKDGSIYYIETVISPILDADMQIKEFIAISYNLTRLTNALDKAREANKSKENFLINMSHEMRTPLNAILGFTPLLKKRLKDDSDGLIMANTIHESGTDLLYLIESVLDINKLRENRLKLNLSDFNPNKLLTKCIQRYKQKALAKAQDYRSDISTSLPSSLYGDALRIQQIFNAVLDNAVKFTPQKGIIDISINYDDIGNSLEFQIKDSGIGIAKEHQERIFDFEQLDNSFTRSHEGAGLGLSITYSLLKLMNGKISVKSIPDQGSFFMIEIPLTRS